MMTRLLGHNQDGRKRLIERTIAVVEVRFETGEEKLKELELAVFVAAGRFRVEAGKVVVEYKISRVTRGGD